MFKRNIDRRPIAPQDVCDGGLCRGCVDRCRCHITGTASTALDEGRREKILLTSEDALKIIREQPNKPIIIEIGSGKGDYLISQAKQNPDCIFIGFEPAEGRLLRSSHRIYEMGLKNIFLLDAYAGGFLSQLPDNIVDKFILLFPTPIDKGPINVWQDTTLEHIARCLKTGGKFYYASDDPETAHAIQSFAEAHGLIVDAHEMEIHKDRAGREPGPKTQFAKRFQGTGKHRVPYVHMLKCDM